MAKDTWLKLHTSLLTSAKFVNLPSSDHRWAFICLLLLAKKGLESCPENFLLAHLNLGKKRWKTVKKELLNSGLLDSDGTVKGFEESQLSPSALRMRQKRKVNKTGTKSKQKLTDAEAEAEAEVEKNMIKSPTFEKVGPDEAKECCRLLSERMFLNDPKARIPKTKKQGGTWIRDMERIHRLDGRTWEEIRDVIFWSQADDFWRSNILSPAKLRKQFPKLLLAMKRKGGKTKSEARQENNSEVLEKTVRRMKNGTSGEITGGSG